MSFRNQLIFSFITHYFNLYSFLQCWQLRKYFSFKSTKLFKFFRFAIENHGSLWINYDKIILKKNQKFIIKEWQKNNCWLAINNPILFSEAPVLCPNKTKKCLLQTKKKNTMKWMIKKSLMKSMFLFTSGRLKNKIPLSPNGNGLLKKMNLSISSIISSETSGPLLQIILRAGTLCYNHRTDNCIKNHFYSRLRKGLRKVNKLIEDSYSK